MEIAMLALYVLIVVIMQRHLWFKASGPAHKKVPWSLLLFVPLIGWFAYGASYGGTDGSRRGLKAGKNASGWAPHWKDW